MIGGSAVGSGNVISGNQFGLQFRQAGTSNNTVQGNFFGTNSTGQLPIGNGTDGIAINSAARIITRLLAT